jgi:REP element-mobilizing transposase RayT
MNPNPELLHEGLRLPTRRKLPHEIPAWVPEGALYFITVNCKTRGHNQLALPGIADAIEKGLHVYQAAGKWWIHLFVVMPDHVHGLMTFSREYSMCDTVKHWKRYLAAHHAIEWEVDFFEHRLRDDASLEEKWHYIRNNPVRAGLVREPDDWPFQWHYGAERFARRGCK